MTQDKKIEGKPSNSRVALLSKGIDKVRYDRFEKRIADTIKGDTKDKKAWLKKLNILQKLQLYRQAASFDLEIDMKDVYLEHRSGVVTVEFSWRALLKIAKQDYPSLEIDMDVVFQGDKYTQQNESGFYQYSHNPASPFSNDRQYIGAFCGIRINGKDTIVLETINKGDIAKMKQASKGGHTWNNWPLEMIRKSVLKRALKRLPKLSEKLEHIIELDNSNSDQSRLFLTQEILDKIQQAGDSRTLVNIHDQYISKLQGEAKETFLLKLKDRNEQLTVEQHGGA